ncbi:DUF1772 domain-containing protein [Dactylosporangium sp. NPDC048998]|uniref:anthrone oxygenase family protein n=1 Tax=Dactylosporangium sp. NPDC048998 TaxID=3363976 RepID=UPI00371328D5
MLALIVSTMSAGLVAGLFYAYVCSVMVTMSRLDDRTFILVMQRNIIDIQNGWFALTFAGTLLFTIVAAALHLGAGNRHVLVPLVVSLVIYIIALFVTFRVNIPLNNGMAQAGKPDRIADPAKVRTDFEGVWNRWNVIRMYLHIASFGCLCWALIVR